MKKYGFEIAGQARFAVSFEPLKANLPECMMMNPDLSMIDFETYPLLLDQKKFSIPNHTN